MITKGATDQASHTSRQPLEIEFAFPTNILGHELHHIRKTTSVVCRMCFINNNCALNFRPIFLVYQHLIPLPDPFLNISLCWVLIHLSFPFFYSLSATLIPFSSIYQLFIHLIWSIFHGISFYCILFISWLCSPWVLPLIVVLLSSPTSQITKTWFPSSDSHSLAYPSVEPFFMSLFTCVSDHFPSDIFALVIPAVNRSMTVT